MMETPGLLSVFEWAAEALRPLSKIFEYLQPIATVCALALAAWWFIIRRQNMPRMNVSHEVKFIELKGTIYVGVYMRVENIGHVDIKFDSAKDKQRKSAVYLEEVSPYLDIKVESQIYSPEYKMLPLGTRSLPRTITIESGEAQTILVEFIIQKRTKAVKVYSHVTNAYNKNIGWDTTTIHEVKYE